MAKFGFLGAGNMAEAIIRGLLDKGVAEREEILITDASAERAAFLRAELGVAEAASNEDLARRSETLVFAVKPQVMPAVLREIAPAARPDALYLSICAGIRTGTIEDGLQTGDCPAPRVVRVMPNTPALIGRGMAGICRGKHATTDDLDAAATIFNAVGETVQITEDKMDAVTALTGSGPAYVFYLIEALEEAAIDHGFTGAQARQMILAMVRGAAELAHGSEKAPTELRRAVTSPGGTTAAGIAVLDQRAVKDAFHACVDAAEQRGRELADG